MILPSILIVQAEALDCHIHSCLGETRLLRRFATRSPDMPDIVKIEAVSARLYSMLMRLFCGAAALGTTIDKMPFFRLALTFS